MFIKFIICFILHCFGICITAVINYGYGGIWGGMQASFHHNIIAHHTSRLSRFQGSRYHNQPLKEKAELCNNIIYSWAEKCSYGGKDGSYNIIGNIFRPGPPTIDNPRGAWNRVLKNAGASLSRNYTDIEYYLIKLVNNSG